MKSLATLTIEQTYAPRDGVLYIEGARAEVEVVDSKGGVRRATGDPGKPLTFHDLPTGRYTVRAGLLPCQANCENLGTRTDTCESQVNVSGDTLARVSYTPTRSCEAVKE